MQSQKCDGAIAQLVEQRTENPCVPGSIPGGTTRRRNCRNFFFFLYRTTHITQNNRTDTCCCVPILPLPKRRKKNYSVLSTILAAGSPMAAKRAFCPSGTKIVCNASHSSNAFSPMLVTELPIVTEVRPLQ